MTQENGRTRTAPYTDPPFARTLFANPEYAWIWLVVRLYVGWQWLDAGWHKLSDPKWMETGTTLKGFWERAVAIPQQGRPLIAYDWYRGGLEFLLNGGHYTWFAKLVAVGETLLGVALIVGIFVGISAVVGGFMNWNFMMAGSASTNPVMLVLSFGLVLAWKTAGYWGVDRWLLPALGTPWQPGAVPRLLKPVIARFRPRRGGPAG
ncbi:MAG: DoxX family membrane protein [Chloroflexi bacterium]|nr:DoxX family membrane protein [Chloroflexota bacterium]